MATFDGSTDVFECQSCGTVALGRGEVRCCGRPMRSAGGAPDDSPVSGPTLDDLLRSVFDMSDTELELCLCVMEGGELTVKELAERTDYDRSVVTRHLNHLADLGVLEKRRRLLERGGQVYVYTPVEPEAVRRSLERGFLAWVVQSARLLEDLRREKVESIVERDDDPQWTVFREE
ncbi:MarR family transcriptional regulator [Salinigranum sp. GCM10025319]|uniref:MarR family transcriptional regulator n=1 Tax=Salinigranum sp. GCM10025319 TaxID=3252687 RepID=UPI003613DA78